MVTYFNEGQRRASLLEGKVVPDARMSGACVHPVTHALMNQQQWSSKYRSYSYHRIHFIPACMIYFPF